MAIIVDVHGKGTPEFSGVQTTSITVAAGATQLFVGVVWQGTQTLNSVTWNGGGMTLIGSHQADGVDNKVALYGLTSPASGTHNIVATFSAATSGNNTYYLSLLDGATDTGWRAAFTRTQAAGAGPGLTVTDFVSGDYVVHVPTVAASTITFDAGETVQSDNNLLGSGFSGGLSYKTANGTVGCTDVANYAEIAVAAIPGPPDTAALTGTATASINENDITAGAKTVISTLTGDTYISNSLVAPVIETADITGSGNNTAETSPDIAYPAHNSGDLLIQVLASDADAAHTAKPNGPNGETTTSVVFNADPGVNGPHLSVMWWIASANTGAGSLIWTIGSEQWDGQTIRVPAGEFDPNDVIEAASSVGSSDADSTVATMPSFVVTKASCRVVCVGGIDVDPMDATFSPSGWTDRYDNDRGAVSSFCATRDAATTASETVASANFGINPTDSYTCIGFAINAPPTSPFEDARAAMRDGGDSAQSESGGWDAKVKPNIPLANIVRTSDTVCTITLQAQADYNITAQETITWTVPASILTGAVAIVATPTFTVDAAGGAAAVTSYDKSIGRGIGVGIGC